jgi:hypothetical protein
MEEVSTEVQTSRMDDVEGGEVGRSQNNGRQVFTVDVQTTFGLYRA